MWSELELAESFQRLLSPVLLAEPWPTVPRVDCQQCRRVEEGLATWEVRCCDVVPVLPNFLVGEILHHHEHPVVLGWLQSRRSDPFAIWVPPNEAMEHKDARVDGRYGKGCPLLVEGGGLCSVYAQRPALCVNYHCYYPSMLWKEAWSCLGTLLELLQDAAAHFLVSLSDLDLGRLAQLWESEPPTLWEDGWQIEVLYEGCWQHWVGREAMFFRWCYEKLLSFGPKELQDVRDWHRQRCMDRLAVAGQEGTDHYRTLDEEFSHRHELQVVACEPPRELRKRLQSKVLGADEHLYSIHQMESYALWYREQLKKDENPSWWMFWRPARQEVAEKEGIAVTERVKEK
ncbi:MAG: hypothetical protein EP343_29785 [Deltaproteobacteria bacterium]|nr:MAG: hypothetical protein EP343_29785 [Deltaproteobacteria bacterium]